MSTTRPPSEAVEVEPKESSINMSTDKQTSYQSEESDKSFILTRNYTDSREKSNWCMTRRYERDHKYTDKQQVSKEAFRTRRLYWGMRYLNTGQQAVRTQIGNSDEIGAFVKLTNSYPLIGAVGGDELSTKFCRIVSDDLPKIAVVSTSLGGCAVIGCMCVGNKHGLIVPDTIYDTELQQIKEELPDSVTVNKIEERLSALGNVVVCNDSVAFVHPELDKESEEKIADTLQVEVFRHTIGNSPLVGSYCVLNNQGGLLSTDTSNTELEDLSSLLELPLVAGTANCGNKVIASSVVVNDKIAYAGMKTTASEFASIETAFGFTHECTWLPWYF